MDAIENLKAEEKPGSQSPRDFQRVRFWGFLVLGLGLAAFLSGCATTSTAESDEVSTIPWNRPASWEGRGPLGGMMMMNGR